MDDFDSDSDIEEISLSTAKENFLGDIRLENQARKVAKLRQKEINKKRQKIHDGIVSSLF